MTAAIFLPGILMPAAIRYDRLFAVLETDVRLVSKELEVYSISDRSTYALDIELDGIDRMAESNGLERFHLYGHSGGGAIALAYAARWPERVLSLALDEPATDFTQQDLEVVGAATGDRDLSTFMRSLVRSDVSLPVPSGPPPAWMADRPAGVEAFGRALVSARVDREALRRFGGPVLYTYGDLSNPRWADMASRLATVFGSYRAVEFSGLHHLNTSHIAEPERVASLLAEHWASV